MTTATLCQPSIHPKIQYHTFGVSSTGQCRQCKLHTFRVLHHFFCGKSIFLQSLAFWIYVVMVIIVMVVMVMLVLVMTAIVQLDLKDFVGA